MSVKDRDITIDTQSAHKTNANSIVPHPDGSGEMLSVEEYNEFLHRYYASSGTGGAGKDF